MSDRIARRLSATAWLVTLAWVAAWGLFRGAFARGGYRWWETAVAFGVSQAALVTAVVLASWLCFQTGLAWHCAPASVGEFFW